MMDRAHDAPPDPHDVFGTTARQTAVIVADSLIQDVAAPLPEFLAKRVNVGALEIARTMGHDTRYGHGPLPAFLHAAAAAARNGHDIHIIFVRDSHDASDEAQQRELARYGPHALRGSDGAAFVSCMADLVHAPCARIVETASLAVPEAGLKAALADILRCDPEMLDARARADVTLVVCGFHTEGRVSATASLLANALRFPHVLVCPHLVGSRDDEAHVRALQTTLPDALVTVLPALAEVAQRLGVTLSDADVAAADACRLEPADVAERFTTEQRRALELVFVSEDAVSLTPLSGGFSGSLLLLAVPSRGGHRRAPAVAKVGPFEDVHRETAGHRRVRDLLGLHVPAMQPPVTVGDVSAVRMSLAAKEGKPVTLQRLFTDARDASGTQRFTETFAKALDLLTTHLYQNTRRRARISPYQAMGLTGPQHARWLRANLEAIIPEADLAADTLTIDGRFEIPNPLPRCARLFAHVDHLEADVALCHGDLNFANVLTDETRAVWIIDWPWCDERPLEYDFAKLENDLTFVLWQDLNEDELPRLADLQRLLAAHIVPPETPPASVATDARFLRLYGAVRMLRQRYDALKTDPHRELLAMARLRFALHTLSFDHRRNRGDCHRPQLEHALLTVSTLLDHLSASPLHQNGPRERPDSYPPRCAVPHGYLSWETPWPGYAPPEASPAGSTAPPAAAARLETSGLRTRTSLVGPLRFDDDGRPLNPLGRTGLRGRGFFHDWGPNLAVDAVVMRVNAGRRTLEMALVKREDTGQWALPGVMLRIGEEPREALLRVAREKLGLELDADRAERIDHGPVVDYRNTDHAWVETLVFEMHLTDEDTQHLAPAHVWVTDAAWLAFEESLAPYLFASHARIAANAVGRFMARHPAVPIDRQALEALLGRL